MTRDSSNRPKAGFAARAIHIAHKPADELSALTPPVFMTSTYAFETAEAGVQIFRGEREGYVYGRTRNPTQALFQQRRKAFMNRLALVTRAVSLGDAKTLVQHPASMTHSPYTRQKHGISDGLIRFSIGLETLSDLKDDILQALDAIHP
jgi:cystathionine beta-lyase/cystathionine gamma-synthase